MHGIHHNTPTGVKFLDGATLQRKISLGACVPTELALLGLDLQTGKAAVTNLSPRQTAAITTIPMALIRTARKATIVEIMAMETGAFSIEYLHAMQLRQSRLSDGAVDHIISEIGIDRIWQGLERATEPKIPAVGILVNHNGAMPVKGNGAMSAHLNF
jgi:hypothetical protein